MKQAINIFWFRRDLRLTDNAGLYHALKDGKPVLPLFIFDTNILDKLDNKRDVRVAFIYAAISDLHAKLGDLNSSLEVHYGTPEEAFTSLLGKYNIAKVYTNGDYEPYAAERDGFVSKMLDEKNIPFHSYKDQVIFGKDEIVKDDGNPYLVYTPYSKRWMDKLNAFYLRSYPTEKYFDNFFRIAPVAIPTLESMQFEKTGRRFPPFHPEHSIIRNYEKQRDFPGVDATSRMGIHLRFGTVSIRKLASLARNESSTYLGELIWREFYMMIFWQFPKLGKGRAFKKEYDNIPWRNNEEEFAAWCEGKTGYPIVDAGMRQLNETGFMHNRVRMIVASFLAKHLLIDWRWGEAYFAERLLDYELASNNGGWQWAAGCGCDAVPYFRIFNPTLQAKKFDPDFQYIRKWVPEFEDFGYPEPIVEHVYARKRCLEVYSKALKRAL